MRWELKKTKGAAAVSRTEQGIKQGRRRGFDHSPEALSPFPPLSLWTQ